ncbi:MAG TPA: hypothetical protein VH475_18530 [Tepidisphaeraceae bacterium]|jgi:hypothetical protein
MKPQAIAVKILGLSAAMCFLAIPISFAAVDGFYPGARDRFLHFIMNSRMPQALFIAGTGCWLARIWVDRIYRRIIDRDSDHPD